MDSPSPPSFDAIVNRLPVDVVPLSSLLAADSPRLSGQDGGHVKTLVETERLGLPPILVHRPTMRVIDGMHRVRAARLRGEQEIEVRFFDGDEHAAFVLSVQSNVTHGMPLTLADRTAAAARILGFYPGWSDRAIARATGLAAATVGSLRRRATDDSVQSNTRLGRDGRRRSVNIAEGRRLAGSLLDKKPDASLREIAKEAGIAPATVRDVRDRLARGYDPVPVRRSGSGSYVRKRRGRSSPAAPGDSGVKQLAEVLERLRKDPSLRSSETGRALLKWLTVQAAGAEKWSDFLDDLPPHCATLVMEVADGLAQRWSAVADVLEDRTEADQGRLLSRVTSHELAF